jgi:hypothetical protein
MSTSMPNFDAEVKQRIKGFWKRPEGKLGAVILLATICAGLYGTSLLLPWAIAFATDFLHLAVLIVACIAVVGTVLNPTFRNLVSNIFQSFMRFVTGVFVTIDPIGILKNNIERMEKQNEELGEGIEGCNGAKTRLETQIAKNTQLVNKDKSKIDEAERVLRNTQIDDLTRGRVTLSRQSALQEIGRKMKSNENLQRVLAQTTQMYKLLCRWQQLAEYNIENTRGQMENLRDERDAILASFKSLGPAKRLIKGDPEELKLVNQSLEFLAEDNAMKLGAMEDFSRYSQKFLTDMDLEQGASAADAEKMLGEFESKLLTAGSGETAPKTVVRDAQAVPVKRSSSTVDGQYLDLEK